MNVKKFYVSQATATSGILERCWLGRLDVVVQPLGFALHTLERVLDHVADRHDADEPLLLNHGHVAELAYGHLLHNGVPALGLNAGRYLTRHDPRQWLGQRSCASLGERSHYVTFRQDADHLVIGTKHHERADPALGQN